MINSHNVADVVELPPDAPKPRLCHLFKWADFDGYGFNLHAEKSKLGQYIGKVDDNSPALFAGLREGDRIIEVNGVNIANENHRQVVERIKSVGNEAKLLVMDEQTDQWYRERKLVVRSTQSNVISCKTPVPRPKLVNGVYIHADEEDEQPDVDKQDHISGKMTDTLKLNGDDDSKWSGSDAAPAAKESQPVDSKHEEEKKVATQISMQQQQQQPLQSSSGEVGVVKKSPSGRLKAVVVEVKDDELNKKINQQQQQQQQQQQKQVTTNGDHSSKNDLPVHLVNGGSNNGRNDVKNVSDNHTNNNSSANTLMVIDNELTLSEKIPVKTADNNNTVKVEEGQEKTNNDSANNNNVNHDIKKETDNKTKDTGSVNSIVSNDMADVTNNNVKQSPDQANDGTNSSTTGSVSSSQLDSVTSSQNGDGNLNLNMSASEMRKLLAQRKNLKVEAKKAQLDLRQKYEIIQQM